MDKLTVRQQINLLKEKQMILQQKYSRKEFFNDKIENPWELIEEHPERIHTEHPLNKVSLGKVERVDGDCYVDDKSFSTNEDLCDVPLQTIEGELSFEISYLEKIKKIEQKLKREKIELEEFEKLELKADCNSDESFHSSVSVMVHSMEPLSCSSPNIQSKTKFVATNEVDVFINNTLVNDDDNESLEDDIDGVDDPIDISPDCLHNLKISNDMLTFFSNPCKIICSSNISEKLPDSKNNDSKDKSKAVLGENKLFVPKQCTQNTLCDIYRLICPETDDPCIQVNTDKGEANNSSVAEIEKGTDVIDDFSKRIEGKCLRVESSLKGLSLKQIECETYLKKLEGIRNGMMETIEEEKKLFDLEMQTKWKQFFKDKLIFEKHTKALRTRPTVTQQANEIKKLKEEVSLLQKELKTKNKEHSVLELSAQKQIQCLIEKNKLLSKEIETLKINANIPQKHNYLKRNCNEGSTLHELANNFLDSLPTEAYRSISQIASTISENKVSVNSKTKYISICSTKSDKDGDYAEDPDVDGFDDSSSDYVYEEGDSEECNKDSYNENISRICNVGNDNSDDCGIVNTTADYSNNSNATSDKKCDAAGHNVIYDRNGTASDESICSTDVSTKPAAEILENGGNILQLPNKIFPKAVPNERTPKSTDMAVRKNNNIEPKTYDSIEIQSDGSVLYTYLHPRTTRKKFPNGEELVQFENGQIEKSYYGGVKEIIFPDGTRKVEYAGLKEEWHYPGGSIVNIYPDESRKIRFANGEEEIHTNLYKAKRFNDGTIRRVSPDGIVETTYPDGRVCRKNNEGAILVFYSHTE